MEYRKRNIAWQFIQWSWFAVMFAMFLRYLYTYLPNAIDSDMASEMVFAKLLSEEGNIFSQNWYYSTEIRVLSTQLIFAPLFLFIKDWFTIRMTGTILCTIILLLSFYSICRVLRIKNFPIYAGMLLCPICHDYFFFVFCNLLYLPYIVILFFSVSLLIQIAENEMKTKKGILEIGALFLLSCAGGMGGFRMFLYLYIPMILTGLFFWIYKKSNLSVKLWTASMIMAGGAGLGLIYYKKVLAIKYSFEEMGSELYVDRFRFDTLENVLNTWMSALGFVSETSLSSKRVLLLETLFAVWLGMICYAICHVWKNRCDYYETNCFFISYFLIAVVIMSGALTLLNWNIITRYVVPVSVLTIPVVAILISGYKKEIVKKFFLIMFMLSSLWIADNYHQTVQTNLTFYYNEYPEIAEFLVKEGYDKGYASFWEGNVMTEQSNGALEMWVCDTEENHFQVDNMLQWLQVKQHDTERPKGKVFVLLTSGEVSDTAWKSDPTGKIIYQTQHYTVYGFSDNNDLREYL